MCPIRQTLQHSVINKISCFALARTVNPNSPKQMKHSTRPMKQSYRTSQYSIHSGNVYSSVNLSGAPTADTVGILALSLFGLSRGDHIYNNELVRRSPKR